MKIDDALSIEDLRKIARKRAPRFIFDYIDGGAEDGIAMETNRQAFDRLRFRPKVLTGVQERNTGTTILGRPSALPVIIGPIGLLGLSWRDGDIEMAKAAAAAGVPYGVSTVSMNALEAIANVSKGRLWFQCYVFRERAITEALVRRAAEAGYEGLIITCDFPVSGKRERDLRSGLVPDAAIRLSAKLEMIRHPRWLLNYLIHRPRFINVERELEPGRDAGAFIARNMFDPSLDWDDFRRFRDQWKGKLLLKGVLRIDDAVRAVDEGADGIVLSNHGGRQLDAAISGMDILPEVAHAIGKRASIIVDGGVRRGSDIAKAIACGAEAVILGRSINYGLAAGGAKGVAKAIDILKDEFDRTLALTGCRHVADLSPDLF